MVPAVGLEPRGSLLGRVFVVGVEYDGHWLGVRRRDVLAGIRFSNTLTDHLAGESRDRLASVRRQLVQLRRECVGQCDLQAAAHRMYQGMCSPAVFAVVSFVVAMWLMTASTQNRPCNFFRACWGPVESGLATAERSP
jgi:hypothetical protein